MHMTAFKTPILNKIVMFLASMPSFEFGCHERLMHKAHHTYTNDPNKDPELLSLFPNRHDVGEGVAGVHIDQKYIYYASH
jgi:fatty acid desaturase